jgi:hypothetical protein
VPFLAKDLLELTVPPPKCAPYSQLGRKSLVLAVFTQTIRFVSLSISKTFAAYAQTLMQTARYSSGERR